jgi:hypothetical protein
LERGRRFPTTDLKAEFKKFVLNSKCVKFDELMRHVLDEVQGLMPEKWRSEGEGIYLLPPDED